MLRKKILFAVAMSTVVVMPSFAADAARREAQKVIEMKNGSTLYIFKDGKMAMEDKQGRAVRMKQNVVMETKDGQKVIMHGDEVMRLDSLLKEDHGG